MPGLGKGVVGLFAKPFGSVFDGISIFLDGIKRFSQSGSESITNVRLPRHLISDVAIFPYSGYLAKGYEILRDLQNDKIAVFEVYWAHVFSNLNKKSTKLIFITDTSIYKLRRTRFDISAKWKVEKSSKPIQVSKIEKCEIIEATKQNDNYTVTQGLFRLSKKQPLLDDKFKDDSFELWIHTETKGIVNNEKNKYLLITSDSDTVEWLSNKINSIVKYYTEQPKKIKL